MTVEFEPATTKTTREGTFTLLLRNTGHIALRPRLTLDPSGDAPVLHLHLFGPAGGAMRRADKVPLIAPHGVGRVAVAVGISASDDPDMIDGTLVVRAVNARLQPVGRAALLPIAASELQLINVHPIPGSVTLKTTNWLPGWLPHWFPIGRKTSGREVELELRGIGVGPLLASQHFKVRALLRSDDGQVIAVRVRAKPHTTRPVIQVLGQANAGTYTGTLPLSNASQASTLTVTIKSRDSIVWALLSVGIGAFFGGLLPLLGKRARRRNVLRAELQGNLSKYLAAKFSDSAMEWVRLEEAIGADPAPWTSTEWLPSPSLSGVAGLFSQLHWAQSDAEFDRLQKEVESLVARSTLWLKLQPKVAALKKLDDERPADIDRARWADTSTAEESALLCINVSAHEPTTLAEGEQKAEALERQTSLHKAVSGVWVSLGNEWEKLAEPRRIKLLHDVQTLASGLGAAAQRTARGWEALDRRLFELKKALEKASEDALKEPVPAAASARRLRAVVAESAAGAIQGTRLGPFGEGVDATSSNLEHVEQWLLGGARAVGRAGVWLWRGPRRKAWAYLRRAFTRAKPARIMASARRQDMMLSIIAALGAMLVYTLQIYTSTWGTPTDYLSAVAAGFGAQAIVRWGALPIFESWKTKQSETGDSKAPNKPRPKPKPDAA